MERQIEVRKRDAKSLSPEELKKELYSHIEWLGLVKYDQHDNDTQRGTLTLCGTDDYDVQAVGNIISNAGYTVIPFPPKLRTAGSTLEGMASGFERAIEGIRQAVDTRLKKFKTNRHINDIVKRKQGERK